MNISQNPGYTMGPNAGVCPMPQATYFGWPLVNQPINNGAGEEVKNMPQMPYAFAQNGNAQQGVQMPQNLYAGQPMINRAEGENQVPQMPQNLYAGVPVVPGNAAQQPTED